VLVALTLNSVIWYNKGQKIFLSDKMRAKHIEIYLPIPHYPNTHGTTNVKISCHDRPHEFGLR